MTLTLSTPAWEEKGGEDRMRIQLQWKTKVQLHGANVTRQWLAITAVDDHTTLVEESLESLDRLSDVSLDALLPPAREFEFSLNAAIDPDNVVTSKITKRFHMPQRPRCETAVELGKDKVSAAIHWRVDTDGLPVVSLQYSMQVGGEEREGELDRTETGSIFLKGLKPNSTCHLTMHAGTGSMEEMSCSATSTFRTTEPLVLEGPLQVEVNSSSTVHVSWEGEKKRMVSMGKWAHLTSVLLIIETTDGKQVNKFKFESPTRLWQTHKYGGSALKL